MSFLGNGTVAHSAGPEALHNFGCGFHFLQRNRTAGIVIEGKHGADGPRSFVLNPRRIFIKGSPVIRPYRLLQQMDGFRGIQMFFCCLASSVLVLAFTDQSFCAGCGKRGFMMIPAVCFNPVQVCSAQGAGCIGEIGLNQALIQTHSLKQLGALVCLEYGYTHLGSDLQHTSGQRLVVIPDCFFRSLVNLSIRAEGSYAGMSQVRVYRPGTEADQHGQLVHVSGLTAFKDHGNRRTLFLSDQMLFQGGHRQQRRNRDGVRSDALVRQDQDIDMVTACLVADGKEMFQCVPQAAFLIIE